MRNRSSSWTVVLDIRPSPATGRRRQKSRGSYRTRKAAEGALRELVASVDSGQFVERSKTPVGDYLHEWLASTSARSVDAWLAWRARYFGTPSSRRFNARDGRPHGCTFPKRSMDQERGLVSEHVIPKAGAQAGIGRGQV